MLGGLRIRQIRSLAREKLIEHDFMRLPVGPKLLVGKLGIALQEFTPPEPDISGFLMQLGSSFGIGYSAAIKNEGFQNFTVAHELGHYFIDGHPLALLQNGPHFSKSGFISKDIFEREADVFATELLMPWKLIEPIIRGNLPGFSAIQQISEQCESSMVASAIRYTEESKECVAVVVSSRGSVEFMVASESFRQIPGLDWMRKSELLPAGVLSRFQGDDQEWIKSGANRAENSRIRSWFPTAPDIEIEEHMVGLGSYGRLLTVLLANFDPEDSEDDHDEGDDDYIARWNEGRFRSKRE